MRRGICTETCSFLDSYFCCSSVVNRNSHTTNLCFSLCQVLSKQLYWRQLNAEGRRFPAAAWMDGFTSPALVPGDGLVHSPMCHDFMSVPLGSHHRLSLERR